MTRIPKFVDSFWDTDLTSTRGSDVIIRRMKEGKRVCKELVDYLNERSKAEAVFARHLKTAARKLEGSSELGDLGASIKTLLSETDRIAAAHETAGGDLAALASELSSFQKAQDGTKSQKEEQLKKASVNKINNFNRTVANKDKYVQKCREKDATEETYKTAKKSVTTLQKDLMKAEKARDKSVEAMIHADTSYRSSIDTLEGARKAWESTMAETCETFQNMEVERIHLTRNILWKVTNVDSQACVTQDQCAENVRQALEKCDIETDLQTFIDNYKVGVRRPDAVLYENYYRGREYTNTTQGSSSGTRPRQPLPAISTSGGGNARPPPPTSPPGRPPAPRQLINFDDKEDDGAYASISTVPSQQQACVVQSFEAKKPYEISVHAGDVITVLNQRSGYFQVKVGNRVGAVPECCLRLSTPH